MSDAATRLNIVELSVSDLSAALKRTIEDGFDHVRVRGELGKVSYHSNGHVYFDLKDDRSCIAGVIWRSAAPRIKLKLEAGLEVICTGRITTYAARSQYQLVVETLEPAGLGALMALLEERKKKLAAEGLFAENRKQLLPYIPAVIGVVTSPTGAVIRDILHRLGDRFPRHVLVWPVRVQGEGSAAEVANAIQGFNALAEEGRIPRPDLLIVARGGGSLEDLWSFNEEIVVRAAAESLIPLISAVGHETDVTLIDFASDRRAPTPTAAAEMAVPVRAELLAQIASFGARQVACWQRGLETRRRELRSLIRALPSAEKLLQSQRQRLDNLSERLPQALRTNAHQHERRYRMLAAKLSPDTLRAHLRVERSRFAAATERSRGALRIYVERRRDRFRALAFDDRARRALAVFFERRADRIERAERLLSAFSYRGVLARGFALVRDAQGRPLRMANQIAAGERLAIEFSDGHVAAVAEGIAAANPAAAPSKPRKTRGGGEGQGSLFS
ncbi:MAG: exodeoxyribonuclease VII large subunit [Pseudorhodoplanes sp.]